MKSQVLNVTPSEDKKDDNKEQEIFSPASFAIDDEGNLLKSVGDAQVMVANFHLMIVDQKIMTDGKLGIESRELELTIHLRGNETKIYVAEDVFLSSKLLSRVMKAAGPTAMLYESVKDLRLAAQQLSGIEIPERVVMSSHGFGLDDNFYSGALIITPRAILEWKIPVVDHNGGTFSRKLGLLKPDSDAVRRLGQQILDDFHELKRHAVTYPVIGHVSLSPFSSHIRAISGRSKPALHLFGPSGCGKTYLASLASCFGGDLADRTMSWAATANAIELEGFFFKDAIYFVDDLKVGVIDHKSIIRIFQNYADGTGRSRLRPGSTKRDNPFIRGLLLSTGEDFIENVESVRGRVMVLRVEEGKNLEAGKRCWENRRLYPTFLPGMIQMVIKDENWMESLATSVQSKTEILLKATPDFANGFRVVSNFALNWVGFELMIRYLFELKIISESRMAEMNDEYVQIASEHIRDTCEKIIEENPVDQLFNILHQKMQTKGVWIAGTVKTDKEPGKGRLIGKFLKDDNVVALYPDITMELVTSHFRAVGRKVPFSRNALKEGLIKAELIEQDKPGRWTKQVRGEDGRRHNTWAIKAEKFNALCGIVDAKVA